LTYVYQYGASALIVTLGLLLARRAGTLTKGWAALIIVGFFAYALGHAFFQFIAPLT